MRQNITKEQWDEINEGDRILWIKWFCIQTRCGVIPCSDDFKQDLFPTIGQMLEFLGDGLKCIEGYDMAVVMHDRSNEGNYTNIYSDGELADNLWLAVKHKLKK